MRDGRDPQLLAGGVHFFEVPGGSGIKVLEAVKKDRPAPLVIMLTNFDHPQYRNRCMQLGADHFLDKSNNFERVIEIVRDFTPAPCPGP